MSKMPVLFIGHGSPMNAIEDNSFTHEWEEMAKKIPIPKTILVISAHWYVKGTKVLEDANPKMTYDMYGFPKKLYQVIYNAPGAVKTAKCVQELLGDTVQVDNSWGYDHGNWAVLHKMYPNCDIPVTQLSVDQTLSAEGHFLLGQKLKPLRDEGVLILASGDVVHNLQRADWNSTSGYDWAETFDHQIRDEVLAGRYENIINYEVFGKPAQWSVPTPDHYYPLLYMIGAADADDKVKVYNDACVMGSLSMTSYLLG
ncbi:Aromatic ring-opening dioxygenase, catalytic subunit, LigB family [Propionispira arboris]|uniref:Aromatic ring-opening dioxygenase, catalytic subunit, LigB family n=1 Tax=Propionispira arboris TaxID=84035 RepID=A0A1H6VMY4_9FIRM|nr:4,5-DOPA dioxygenase extradiol [Propionispira arboris]SEJ06009.1 Aromatic ring-opening dioxygenase, catalytic subunit, LigB family [Propionispira arboris]